MSLSAQNTLEDSGVLYQISLGHSEFEGDVLIRVEFIQKRFRLKEYEN